MSRGRLGGSHKGEMDRSLLYQVCPYNPPSWVAANIPSLAIPSHYVTLGRFPTPIAKFALPLLEEELVGGTSPWDSNNIYIKRDDLSSSDLSGNKVRKLEFLLPEALINGHDSVITIGGIQSNHARATAIASRQLGLEPHLILRGRQNPEDMIPDGNLLLGIFFVFIMCFSLINKIIMLLDRLVDSHIHTVTPATYATIGSASLTSQLKTQLEMEGKKPYVIPVGGSNPLGSFGYMEMINELNQQAAALYSNHRLRAPFFDHIVFACGSGGTAAGIVIATKLSGCKSKIHAIGVCDSPEHFYSHIEQNIKDLNISNVGDVREFCSIYDGKNLGYARVSDDEIEYLLKVSSTTGIILDPVYSGKALYFFVKNVLRTINTTEESVVFVHTGGGYANFASEYSEKINSELKNDFKIKKMIVHNNK